MMEERIKRELHKAAEKEAQKKKMMDVMEENYLAEMAKADERVARNIRVLEEKQQNDEEAKRALRQQELEAIHCSRQQQLQLKEERQRKKLREEEDAVKVGQDQHPLDVPLYHPLYYFSFRDSTGTQIKSKIYLWYTSMRVSDRNQAWKLRTKEIEQEELDSIRYRKEQDLKTKRYLDHQVERKKMKASAQLAEEDETVAMLQLSLQEEETRFEDYAKECTNEWKNAAKSTQPMELYLTAKQGVDTI